MLQPSSEALPLVAGAVVVRRMAVTDLRDFQAYRCDAELARFQGWSAQTDADARRFLESVATMPLFMPGEWIQLGIAEAASPKLIGDIGVFIAKDGSIAEVGFTLAKAAQGAGLATAAVRATIDLIFACTSVAKVIAVTDKRNIRSIKLLDRTDMRLTAERQAEFKGEWCTELVFERVRQAQATRR